MTVTADTSSADTFATKVLDDRAHWWDRDPHRQGSALHRYQWRGRGFDTGKPDDPWREVMFVERNAPRS